MVGEGNGMEKGPASPSKIMDGVVSYTHLPPRDMAVVDLPRYDTPKVYTCHRYERVAVDTLAGKSEHDVTGIIGLRRASQTISIPHKIHKTLCTREHATSAFCHRKPPAKTFHLCTRCKTPRVSVRAKSRALHP